MKNVKLPLLITVCGLLIISIIADYKMPDKSFHTGKVTKTILNKPPVHAGGLSDFDPWILRVQFEDRLYNFPVTREVWSTIGPGDYVLIEKTKGCISGVTYNVDIHKKFKYKTNTSHVRQ